jgi:hypothetical protein
MRSPSIRIAFLCVWLAASARYFILPLFAQSDQPLRVSIRIDTKQAQGPLKPIYSFFGYDEPNYTYMKDGQSCCLSSQPPALCQSTCGCTIC